jgi:O-antigen biosynthesis protein
MSRKRSICVGVHVHAEPARLRATLDALERTGRFRVDILLLPDGPDRQTAQAVAACSHRVSVTERPASAPACFNRLAAETDAAVIVLLESGALPAPGAIDRLAAALSGDVGLCGPSTNRSWNDQAAFPAGDDVARTGRTAARRYGRAIQSLAPLHGIGDFCLAVRRDVVEAIGGADENYGLGPCWEMEYAVRAARAGFRSVWVQGAYVWRPPFTDRRARGEERLFEASRRRYQDSLCGLRLRGQLGPYEPHCRGDDCEHFAPAGLITIRRPLEQVTTTAPSPAVPPAMSMPLVSCLMPTRGRAEFALNAVRLFQEQDYEHRELVIVDDGDDDGLEARLPDDGRIRYLRSPAGESIGLKRNRACDAAQGAYLAQWDDDDWYGPGRLSSQVAPLVEGRADITGLITPLFFDLPNWQFWSITPNLHRRLFVGDVHGGTLVFARHVWERLARYPNASLAEDASFLTRAKARGARVERVDGTGLFVYVRHDSNAWRFDCGSFFDRHGWRPGAEPLFSAEDREFYARHSDRAPADARQPLVTCVMPTADRRRFVAQSIAYFLRQDYPTRELLVVDDGADRVSDLVPADPRIRYVALAGRLVLGEKRNRMCELARGDIIVHWDDDDWQSPSRLSYQVGELERHGAAICGPSRVLYFDPGASRAWLYDYPTTRRPWIAGNALCYRKDVWREHPFPRVDVGEDTRFVWGHGKPLVLSEHRFLVGLVHGANTSRKLTTGAYWRTRPLDEVKGVLGSDYGFYEEVR